MATYVIGIDEVGRGSLAGPLVVCAFALEQGVCAPTGIQDSKKFATSVSGRRKLRAVAELLSGAFYHCVRWAGPEEVDDLGIDRAWTNAVVSAGKALAQRLEDMGHQIDQIVVDGNQNPLYGPWKAVAVIGADGTVPAVSAASIVAKSRQLKYMADMATVYPQYGFEKGAGYGTKQHLVALERYGMCPIHRRTFAPMKHMQKILAPQWVSP